MKKFLLLLLLVASTVSANNRVVVGNIENVNGIVQMTILADERNQVVIKTNKTVLIFEEYNLTRFTNLLKINLELVDVGKNSDIKYKRMSGATAASYPRSTKLMFEFYCDGSGGENASTVSFIIFNNEIEETVVLSSEGARQLLSLMEQTLEKSKAMRNKAEEFNLVLEKIKKIL